MCVIIDIPVVHRVFPTPEDDFRPLHAYLMDRRTQMVYGGKLRREYLRIEWFRRLLVRLDQQGSAWQVQDQEVDAATRRVHGRRLCLSNDHHIIALALVAQARLLCTDDNDLMDDFKNKILLNNPRGKVYRYASHRYLLRDHCNSSSRR